MARWNKLQGDSNARNKRLLHVQEQFRQIEEPCLRLTFAKKASAFILWLENAEKDMSDPARCNSIQEIKYLQVTFTLINFLYF